jgi:hypothetical protein
MCMDLFESDCVVCFAYMKCLRMFDKMVHVVTNNVVNNGLCECL